jgi:hypothetical protein
MPVLKVMVITLLGLACLSSVAVAEEKGDRADLNPIVSTAKVGAESSSQPVPLDSFLSGRPSLKDEVKTAAAAEASMLKDAPLAARARDRLAAVAGEAARLRAKLAAALQRETLLSRFLARSSSAAARAEAAARTATAAAARDAAALAAARPLARRAVRQARAANASEATAHATAAEGTSEERAGELLLQAFLPAQTYSRCRSTAL